MAHLSSTERAKVSAMAEKMAAAGFKGSKKGKFANRSTKQQKFAVATSNLKKRGKIK